MSLALLRVCALASCASKALSRCAPGWTFADNSCFYLLIGLSELSEPQASSACEAVGAVLAQPRSEEQEHMLLGLIRQSPNHIWPERPGHVWVGAWSTPPQCESSCQSRILHLDRPDSHGECVDPAGSSARASLCEKPAADSRHFRRLIFDFDSDGGPAAELLQWGFYCVGVFLVLLLLIWRITDLREGAVQVAIFFASHFFPRYDSQEIQAHVQKVCSQRRVLFGQLAAVSVLAQRIPWIAGECSGGSDYTTLCGLATSYVLLASFRWERWRGPWCLRLFALGIAVLRCVDIAHDPDVLISHPKMQRDVARRVFLMLSLRPVESLTANTIFGITLCAMYPVLGIEGRLTFYAPGSFNIIDACGKVVSLRELDSLSSMMAQCAKENPDHSHAALDRLVEILNMFRGTRSSLESFVQAEATRTLACSIYFLVIHMAMSHDLRQKARTHSLESLAEAMSALMERFCDASAQLSHDFTIVKPARRLAGLLNVAGSHMGLAGSNFCKHISCEQQRRAFVLHLETAKSSGNGLACATTLNMKDAFSVEVPITIICHHYEALGNAHYLIGITEMQERQDRQEGVGDSSLAPMLASTREGSCTNPSVNECAGDRPTVNVDYVDSELRVKGTNVAFERFLGCSVIPPGTPLQEIFPEKSEQLTVGKGLMKARECAESNQEERHGCFQKPLTVRLSATAGGAPRRNRFAKVQFVARPALSPDGEQSQLTLQFFPCREEEGKKIRRTNSRKDTTRSEGSDGSRTPSSSSIQSSTSSEDERLSTSVSRGVRRGSSSASDEVDAKPRATTVGSKLQI